jgi:Skp family chaperone for outer membrane proteins
MNKLTSFLAALAIVFSLAGLAAVAYFHNNNVNYGFVNTEKLLNSFVESQKAMDEIRVEEEKWTKERTIIEDSLKAFEERIAATYEKLTVDEKRKVKAEQVARIEELGRFNQARSAAIQNKRLEKLQSVYQKINAALVDFASEKGLDVVFASSNGSIIYGDGTDADLTEKFLLFLNNRFK